MLVDSWYDAYLGVVVLVRVIDGKLKKGQKVRMMGTGATYDVDRVGVITPKLATLDELGPGEIGFMTASIKEVAIPASATRSPTKEADSQHAAGLNRRSRWCSAGSSRWMRRLRRSARRHGQAAPQRCELFLRDGKLSGARFRLPLRVPRAVAPRNHPGTAGARVQPRPHRDRPVGGLRAANAAGRQDDEGEPEVMELHNPADMPDVMKIEEIREPWITATILTPDEYLGAILKLCQERRGIQKELSYVGARAMLVYNLPLNEVVFDFYDRLKSSPKAMRASTIRSPAMKPATW
jgi:GTP-binding protein LepA